MNKRPAPCGLEYGFTGHGQSGNSGDRGTLLDPPSSNADIVFKTTPFWGQE
ncbi:hypothetical protein FHS54_002102 [Sphingobium vermicomposti]|uniref:Uncharacterized protein n=1 Tax=Sphingobium vermicomposti TaxID=529005 RepID=A0A846M6I8_9SPHN|nr:hypothetical protein [Sphingobium vermicomposti]